MKKACMFCNYRDSWRFAAIRSDLLISDTDIMLLNINATRGFFVCDLYAGVVPQMSSPPHDLERLRTTMVDFIVIFNRGRSVVSWTLYG